MNDCVDIEPQTNIKCIYFTFFIVFIYWFLPPRNKYILVFLFWLPYLIMAIYDDIYSCNRAFGPTYLRLFYEIPKRLLAPGTKQDKAYKNWCPKHSRKVFFIDVIVAIVLIIFYFTFFRHWNPKV